MEKASLLVTGATGFIGRNFLSYCASRGIACRIIIRRFDASVSSLADTHDVREGDLTTLVSNPSIFRGIDTVIHLAARVHNMKETSLSYVEKYRAENTDLTLTLAGAALKSGVRQFIFASTVKCMGDLGKPTAIFPEDARRRLSDPYAVSKFEAEEGLARLFVGHQSHRCVIIRMPMVYGPGNKGNMLPLLRAASLKIPLPLKAATGKRSMIYVGNASDAIAAAAVDRRLALPSIDTFVITDGVDCSSADLYDAIFREMNGGSGVFYVPEALMRMPASVSGRWKQIVSRLFDEYRFSSEEFQKAYEWRPPYSPAEGIRETVNRYRRNVSRSQASI